MNSDQESTSATANREAGSRGGSVKDDGIQAGYMWLVNHIIKHWIGLSERVESESREQQEQEREVMRERYERFRNQTLTPPGAIDDDGDEDPHEDPFKPIQQAAQVADRQKAGHEQQNGESKIPLRSSKGHPAAKSKVDITRSQPESRTPVPAKLEKNKPKIHVEPKKKVPVRKTVLGNSNKVAPITR